MMRLENPPGTICWWNSSMFDIVYVVKICNIPLPEEPAKDDLFMTQFRTWVLLKEPKVFNPERVVKYFIETLSTNNAKAFMKRQQEPLFVFLCLAGKECEKSSGIDFFSFMRFTERTTTKVNKCMQCFRSPGR